MPSPLFAILVGVILTTSFLSAAAIKCPIGTFRKNETCQKCLPGTYQEQPHQTRCKKCPANTYTPFHGVISARLCLDCPEDSISPPGSVSCKKCRNGWVRGCGKCVYCPLGTHVDGCKCTKCSPDSFSNTTSARWCTKCPYGMRATKDRKGCEDPKCPPGTEWYSSSCLECGFMDGGRPSATFRNASMLTCEQCPARTAMKSFVEPRDSCIKCPPGTYVTYWVLVSYPVVPYCRTCPEGTTTKGHGKMICRREGASCPSDFFEDEDGDCETCFGNQRYVPREKKCVDCAADEFSSGGIATKCRRCGDGRILDHSRTCSCPAGTVFKNGKCEDCPAGAYRSERSGDDKQCFACWHGSFSGVGASSCTRCPKGTSSRRSKGKKCEKVICPEGFILPPQSLSYFGDDVCISGATGCPKGLTSLGVTEHHSGFRFLYADKTGKLKTVCNSNTVFDGVDGCVYCDTNDRVVKKKDGRLGCERCPRGTIPDEKDRGKCRPCKKGFIFDDVREECACPRDTFLNDDGKCQRCAGGFGYKDDREYGQICSKCQAGTFSSGSRCVNCPQNMTSSAGATKCTACPPGTMSLKGYEYDSLLLPFIDATCTPI